MGRKKSNNALNKENKKKSISVSPNKVNGDLVLEKKKTVILSALKSNSKKIKKVRFQILNVNNIICKQKADSSIPAANKLSTTGKKRKVSVALEKLDIIDKMVDNNSVDTNCKNLLGVNGRKRKGTPTVALEKSNVIDKMVVNNTVDTNCKNLPGVNGRKRKGTPTVTLEKSNVIDKMVVNNSVDTNCNNLLRVNRRKRKETPTVTLEKLNVIDKMVVNNSVDTNCNNLPSVKGRKRKGTPNTDLMLNPKKKGMLPDKNQSLQPEKVEKKGVIDQMKHLKIVRVTLESPTKAKMIKDLQETSSSSIEKNGKVGKKNMLRLSPNSKKAKNNKSKNPLPTIKKSIEKNDIADKKKENSILPALKKAKNNKSKSPPSMNTKGIEKNGIAGKVKDFEISPGPKSANHLKIVLVNLETPMLTEDFQKKGSSITEENGKFGKKMLTSPKSKKAKTNKSKSPPPMKSKNFVENVIADSKNIESIKKGHNNNSVNLEKPISNKECFTIDQCKDSINLQRTRLTDFRRMKHHLEIKIKCIKDKGITGLVKVQLLTNLEKLKNSIYDEKKKLEILQQNLRQTMIKDQPYQVCTIGPPEPVEDALNTSVKKELVLGGKTVIGVNDITVQINDSENFERNENCFTIEQFKDYVNFQKFRLNDMRKIRCLDARKIKRREKKGIPGLVKVEDLLNLKKLRDSISDKAKKLDYLQKRLDQMIKKANPLENEIKATVEETLNTYIRKKLMFGGETIIGVNVRLGLLANISEWSVLLANLPKEDRVMIFEPPSLLVPFLTESEPLQPLRQAIKDLGLLVQKEQEEEELEQQSLALQTPAAKLDDNGPSLPSTDDSEAKVDAAPVTMVDLEETVNCEKGKEEEIPKKKKGKGFKKANYDDESDSSWEDSSSEESLISDDEYTIIKQDLKICDIVNLENKKPITDNAASSCLRSDNYFNKPVGKFLIDIGSGLAHEYFQRDMLREQRRRLHEQEKLQKTPDLLKRSIHILRENLKISAESNADFKFKQKICKLCDFQSESLHVMAFHMNSPHSIEGDKFKCNYCDIQMDSSSVILEHMKAVHGISGHVETPLRDLPCPLCPSDFKYSVSAHTKTCFQRFDINRNLVPEFWDLPAKIMPQEVIKCHDKFVNDIRTFLSKSSVGEASADDAGQTTMENMKATSAFTTGESITNPSPDLATPAWCIKSVLQEKKERKKDIEELLKIANIQLS